jgi:phosphoribosylformimino-5-aminoimidazole carboxamide ribotide isomerase
MSSRAGQAFELIPAIDLAGGRVVRLVQGDFARETAYSSDPLEVAERFAIAGARWLHVVDLDGARTGTPVQSSLIAGLTRTMEGRLACQVAGGLRSAASVAAAFAAGAARVVIGTAALTEPTFAGATVARHGPGRLIVALDVRDGVAVGDGWRAGAVGVGPAVALAALADQGVTTFAVTAIERDGLLGGPDLELLERLVGLDRGRILASGGIRDVDDVLATRAVGCAGAIVGRALYDGRLDLAEALRRLGG